MFFNYIGIYSYEFSKYAKKKRCPHFSNQNIVFNDAIDFCLARFSVVFQN